MGMLDRRHEEGILRILIADDSADAISQMSAWILERWPSAELMTASTPEDAIRVALEGQVENLILDLDFGVQRQSGVAIAQRVPQIR